MMSEAAKPSKAVRNDAGLEEEEQSSQALSADTLQGQAQVLGPSSSSPPPSQQLDAGLVSQSEPSDAEAIIHLLSDAHSHRLQGQRSVLEIDNVTQTSSSTDGPVTPRGSRGRISTAIKRKARNSTAKELEPLIRVCTFFQDSRDNDVNEDRNSELTSVSDPGNSLVVPCQGWCLETDPTTLPSHRYLASRGDDDDETGFSVEEFVPGARFYRDHFYNQDHHNFVGRTDELGSFVISIRREPTSVSPVRERLSLGDVGAQAFQYRVIVRSSKTGTQRMVLPEEAVGVAGEDAPAFKHVMKRILPDVPSSSIRQTRIDSELAREIMQLDECGINASMNYQVGVLLCKSGQSSEPEMYNNAEDTPHFRRFLALIGKKIRLKGYTGFKAGLDVKDDHTGTHSYTSSIGEREFMLHVSTCLPFNEGDEQQVLRKSKIGNDVVTVIFQEPGAAPVDIASFASHMLHVLIIVRCVEQPDKPDEPVYSIAVARRQDVPEFGPSLSRVLETSDEPNLSTTEATFSQDQVMNGLFKSFLMTKVVNAQHASYVASQLRRLAARTRRGLLEHIVDSYGTEVTLADMHKRGSLSRFVLGRKRLSESQDDLGQDALTWRVKLEQPSSRDVVTVELVLTNSMVVIRQPSSSTVLHSVPCAAVHGWLFHAKGLQLWFGTKHDSAVLVCSREDRRNIVTQLQERTQGSMLVEYTLYRESRQQSWGFVVCDGVVKQVAQNSVASLSGLRVGDRLLLMNGRPVQGMDENNLRQTAQMFSSKLSVLVKVPDTYNSTKSAPASVAGNAPRSRVQARRGSQTTDALISPTSSPANKRTSMLRKSLQQLDRTPRSGRAFDMPTKDQREPGVRAPPDYTANVAPRRVASAEVLNVRDPDAATDDMRKELLAKRQSFDAETLLRKSHKLDGESQGAGSGGAASAQIDDAGPEVELAFEPKQLYFGDSDDAETAESNGRAQALEETIIKISHDETLQFKEDEGLMPTRARRKSSSFHGSDSGSSKVNYMEALAAAQAEIVQLRQQNHVLSLENDKLRRKLASFGAAVPPPLSRDASTGSLSSEGSGRSQRSSASRLSAISSVPSTNV